jgi:hypothetical protein
VKPLHEVQSLQDIDGRALERARTEVMFELLLLVYPQLAELARFVHPTRVAAVCGAGVQCDADEPFVAVVPSPFRRGARRSPGVVILPRRRQWYDLSGYQPCGVPRDFVGFVMVYSQCSQREAVETLNELVDRSSCGQDGVQALDAIRSLIEEQAEVDFLGASIRESILSRLN